MSSRNCLLIHGVKENEKENNGEVVIEIFENKTQEKVSVSDIDWSHLLGKKHTRSKPHLLSLNLPSTMSVVQFLETKKIIKGKVISITENLTKKRIIETKRARETYGFKNVYSQDGKMLYKDVNDRKEIKVFYD